MTLARSMRLAMLAGLLAAPLGAQQPTGTIRGRVTDEASQSPLARVTVMVGNRSTITAEDGRYLLSGVPAGNDSLRARIVGYAPFARSVFVQAGQTLDIDIALAAQAVALAEMVVVGYGEQAAGNVTGAITAITPAEFNVGRIVSPSELIQNKAAGVQVVENNEPGGGTSIRIRGTTSVNASSEPLYVVDGVPMGTGAGGGLSAGRDPLNYLNPNDIESITILRDASAAAIYGANAANGVVMITTRSGRRGPQFEYTSSFSMSSITRRPDMLSTGEFRTAVQAEAPANAAQLLSANTDWYDLVTRTGMGQDHNLAVSGAGDNMAYRLSLGWLDQEGIVRGTTTQRLSLGVNYEQRLFRDRIQVRGTLRGSRAVDEFTPGGVLSNAAQMGGTQPVFDNTTPSGYYDWPGGLQSPDNPIAILNLATDRGSTLRSVGNVQAEYRTPWVRGLTANLNIGYDVTRADRDFFRPSVLHREVVGSGGSFTRRNHSMVNTLFESYLNWTVPQNVGPGILDLTGGYSFSQSHAEYPEVRGTGLATDLLGPNGDPGAAILQNSQWIDESRLVSFFGRVNYNIGDRYLAALTVRRDGSSRFGPTNQWGTFPALSLAWRISQEPWLRGNRSLSDLKLRASWARTGNQAFANYQQYSRYQVGDAQSAYAFGGAPVGTIRPSAYDPNIRWEATSSTNIGVDYGFWNQRFSGSFDWYTKTTTDLIFEVPVAAGTNLSNFLTTNIGSMRNRGFEFSLSARVRDGGANGLRWTADFTAANNSNELVSINPRAVGSASQILTGLVSGGVGTYIQVLTPGEAVNSFFVYEHRRDAAGNPIYTDNNGLSGGAFTGTPDGTINEQDLYVDQNGDNVITQADRRPFHDPAPKWIFSHSSYFNYRRLDFGFTLRAYTGNYVYNNVASNLGAYAEVRRGSPFNLHRSVLETGFQEPQYLSDYYVEDASFLRMDNLTAGYSFTYRGQPARVFASVQSVLTLTGYSGVDPTAGLNGLDNNIYPRARTFTTGLSVRF